MLEQLLLRSQSERAELSLSLSKAQEQITLLQSGNIDQILPERALKEQQKTINMMQVILQILIYIL